MSPSILDIPDHLLSPDKFDEFRRWLLPIPIDWQTCAATVRLWSQVTQTPISPDAWAHLETDWERSRAHS